MFFTEFMDNSILKLFENAIKKRQSLTSCTNARRLVNGVGDGLEGLVLEEYNRHFVAQLFDKRWLREDKVLIDFVKKLGAQYFIVKNRSESASSQPDAFKAIVWIEHPNSQTTVHENGLTFSVDLNDTLNTGLFLDMRNNRKTVAELSSGRKVLNCFSYTCSFGVYCRAAGALSVVNVDISRKSLARGLINYELNQVVASRNEFIRVDAVEYLERAVKKNNCFDLIILDPPSFARGEGKNFTVKKDLQGVVNSAMKILNPQGVLFLSTNFSSLSSHDLEKMVRQAGGDQRIKKVEHFGQDIDFVGSGKTPESYLAAILVKT